ncbi:TonB-dependent receptor [Compostibacter hankyongensis]|uniref:TonB-dependent receptor n=2 Tax=Compostibacter hankyongensis TaxID=1007089 RepID=A0ABP8FPV4_9BACT
MAGCAGVVYGQVGTYTVRGVLRDSVSREPLPLATVYAKKVRDSSLVSYTLTNDQGAFLLEGIPRDTPVQLTLFYTGYRSHRQRLEDGAQQLNLGTIYLSMSSTALDEVTVTGERPPIAIRGDTLEFNAAAFKTRPNSVIEDLLKKLPGVDVDADGNITAEGKPVSRILVDGKAFFGNDPRVASKNLPVEIVDKVQVTDTKTREEELSGAPASGDTKTLNITLKKGKDQGFFGRAYADYGTDRYYDASAMLNYFKGKQRISILGAVNNINDIGFSIDEVVDMLGGGGGVRTVMVSRNGAFGINGLNFGNNEEGIKKTTTAGINYNNDFGKHFSLNGSYFYGGLSLENDTKTARQNLLPDSLSYYNTEKQERSNNINHRMAATLTYKDSLWNVYYAPNISFSNKQGVSNSHSVSLGEKQQPVNESDSRYVTDQQDNTFSQNLNIFRTFKRKGQMLSLSAYSNIKTSRAGDYNSYRNSFYDDATPDDSVNQYIDNNVSSNDYNAGLRYTQPLTDKLRATFAYNLEGRYGLTDKKTFDLEAATGKHTQLDSAYTNKFRSNVNVQTPRLGTAYQDEKWQLDAAADFNFIGLHHYSYTHDLSIDQRQFFISPYVNLARKIKNGRLSLRYLAQVQQPDIAQLLPVADNTNPLYIIKGNPDLKPSIYRNLSLDFNNFDFKSGNNVYGNVTYSDIKNAITDVTTFDEQLRQVTTYTNVAGNYQIRGYGGIGRDKKKENSHWRVNLNLMMNYNHTHAFVNEAPYVSNRLMLAPRLSYTYGYKELYEITPSYRFRYESSQYSLGSMDSRHNIMHEAGFSGSLYWPTRLSWESDLNYTYNSDVAPGFRKGYWLWNVGVGVDLFKKRQATLKFTVYDLLNQNTSVRREITDTYIEDRETIVLHRYFMLKLIYNLRKFGESDKNGPGRHGGRIMIGG